jgi:transmembrane sensor
MEQQQFITLIIKQISNDITAEELLILDEWLQASADNRQLAKEYRQAWDLVPVDEPQLLQPDLDASYARLMQRIQPASAAPMRVWSRFAARAAAAVAFLLIGTWAYQRYSDTSTPMLTVTSGDMEKKEVMLPDQSKVWLRKGSTLTYPVAFSGTNRAVKLEGEAFFEVSYDPDHHFYVDLPRSERIEVLGTSFNIKPSASSTTITVVSGKVRFKPDPAKTADVVIPGGERAVYMVSTSQISLTKSLTNNDLAWQKGGLEFEGTPIRQVIEDMESYFGVNIEIEDNKMLDCTYSSNLLKGNVNDVLKGLSATFKMKLFNPSPDRFELTGGTCL